MHPNGSFEEELGALSLESYRCVFTLHIDVNNARVLCRWGVVCGCVMINRLAGLSTPHSTHSLHTRAMQEPLTTTTEAAGEAEAEAEQARIKEDLGRLLEVWATLSEDTKSFLQMQAAIPSVRSKPPAVPTSSKGKGQDAAALCLAAAFAHHLTPASSTASLATLVPPASPIGHGGYASSGASSASTSPQRPQLLPRAPSPALSSLSVSSSSSTTSSVGGAASHRLEPVARAPDNVFVLRDEEVRDDFIDDMGGGGC